MRTQREELVDAAVELLERDGVQALSARNLATKLGTSTMAVYTHFGSMAGLMDAVGNAALSRFTESLAHVPPTDDPVADFLVMGLAYRRFALSNPQRYQLIFGTETPQPILEVRADVTVSGSPTDRPEWAVSFEGLHAVVRRMIAAGRIRDEGSLATAARLWTLCHGAVTLEMAGFFGNEGRGLAQIMLPLGFGPLSGRIPCQDRSPAEVWYTFRHEPLPRLFSCFGVGCFRPDTLS